MVEMAALQRERANTTSREDRRMQGGLERKRLDEQCERLGQRAYEEVKGEQWYTIRPGVRTPLKPSVASEARRGPGKVGQFSRASTQKGPVSCAGRLKRA